jgi:hypothetical protein
MMRALSLSLLAAAAVAALAGPADADHRWYHRHIFFPLTEVFPGGWNDEDDYADQNGQDAAMPVFPANCSATSAPRTSGGSTATRKISSQPSRGSPLRRR